MAFVSVPKDLSKVKTKVALNLTKRQIISFSLGAVIGFPVYWNARTILGNDLAIFLMIGCILPFFFAGIFEKDGIVFEKYVGYIIRQKFLHPKVRVYKTENFYAYLDTAGRKEVIRNEWKQDKKAVKTAQKKPKSTEPKQKKRAA